MASLKVKLIGAVVVLVVVLALGFYAYASVFPHDVTVTLTAAPPPVNGPVTARPGTPG